MPTTTEASTPELEIAWAKALENEGLLNKVARQISNRYSLSQSFEELKSFGWEGLLEACLKHDPSLGYAFSTLAHRCIYNAIMDEVRRERRQKRSPVEHDPHEQTASMVSLEQWIESHNADSDLRDFVPESMREEAEQDQVWNSNFVELYEVIPLLPEPYQTIIRLYYLTASGNDNRGRGRGNRGNSNPGYTDKEIGAELGWSESWAAQHRWEGLKLLRELLMKRLAAGENPEVLTTLQKTSEMTGPSPAVPESRIAVEAGVGSSLDDASEASLLEVEVGTVTPLPASSGACDEVIWKDSPFSPGIKVLWRGGSFRRAVREAAG